MTIARAQVAELLALLASEDAMQREEAAETISDWGDSYNPFDPLGARILVRVLALLASVEESVSVREAELNALNAVFNPATMSADDVSLVLNIPSASLDPGARDHVDVLRELLDGAR